MRLGVIGRFPDGFQSIVKRFSCPLGRGFFIKKIAELFGDAPMDFGIVWGDLIGLAKELKGFFGLVFGCFGIALFEEFLEVCSPCLRKVNGCEKHEVN